MMTVNENIGLAHIVQGSGSKLHFYIIKYVRIP